MACATIITVYTEIPNNTDPRKEDYLDHQNWTFVPALRIPFQRLCELNLSLRPYKWIRYAVGVVMGAEGDLSSEAVSLRTIDYETTTFSEELAHLYYWLTDEEKKCMYPIDPQMESAKVTSSVSHPRRAKFLQDISKRDHNCCVITGMSEESCQAVHLFSHSKGDQYIRSFTDHRSRGSPGNIVDRIDSVRNGIYLNAVAHPVLGKTLAFLPIPNFAMGTNDVSHTEAPDQTVLLAHNFKPEHSSRRQLELLGNTDSKFLGAPVRRSNTLNWPPTILFEATYAIVVLNRFGLPDFRTLLSDKWGKTFYPNSIMSSSQALEQAARNDAASRALDKRIQAEKRQARWEKRAQDKAEREEAAQQGT